MAGRGKRIVGVGIAVAVLAGLPAAGARHDAGCEPTYADPSTYRMVDVGDRRLYVEERPHDGRYGPEGTYDVPPPTRPPPPLWGGLFGDGFWIYEEENGLPGLQRGGPGITGPICWPPPTWPCLVYFGFDPWTDQNCGHGPDRYMFI